MERRYFAHSGREADLGDAQPLRQHLIEVAEIAATSAERFGAAPAARLAGLLHDLGKYTPAFQKRLTGGESVDHATAGAKAVMTLTFPSWRDGVMAQILGYLIAGHHKGLEDGDQFQETLKKSVDDPDPIWRSELALADVGLMPPGLKHIKGQEGFALAFLGRMIFSCLIDADRRDTSAFDRTIHGRPALEPGIRLPDVLDRCREAYEAHMARFSTDGPVNGLRRDILEAVRAKATLPPGLFTLTVPTGGGKTLATVGFALDHAKAHGLERIIYAIPFTSVIDQTVGIIEDVVGKNMVLAHHSGFNLEKAKDEQTLGEDEHRRLNLAMEDWDSPVIVTTNVQIFESLFSHRPTQCRKLHRLARSVIILDEAQTIPLHVLRPCLAAIDELRRNYGCTIVLCTATQPAVTLPKFKGGLDIPAERELAPDPAALHEKLRRVTIRHAGVLTDEEVLDQLEEVAQGLVIVNTRGHALTLFRAAEKRGIEDIVHLTTRQYGAERQRILANVRARLDPKARRPCRLIATSLVEAGVDLDFDRVWRAEAGLDSIIQAAGRCNREGKRSREDSIVAVFEPAEAKPPREIQGFIGDAQRAALDFDDLLAPASIERYFREVYWRKDDGLDAIRIADGRMQRLLDGRTFGLSGKNCIFDYRTVGENFRLILDGMAPVIVAREPAAEAILAKLNSPNVKPGSVARALQPYVVQVPPKARARLVANRHAAWREQERFGDQFCVLRTPDFYQDKVGLLWEDAEYLGIEQSLM